MKLLLAFSANLPHEYYVEPHAHAGIEIVYYVEGAGQSRIGTESYDFTHGTCLTTPTGIAHDQTNRLAASSICLVCSGERLTDLPVRLQDRHGILGWLCQRLLHEVNARAPGYEDISDGLLLEIVGVMRRLAATATDTPTAHTLVNRALDMIRESDGCISPGDLADRLYVSPDYLRQLMREYTARSPIRHVLELRLRRACELLTTTTLTVKEISERCGFHDPAYFTRLFKKSLGQSPSQYRELH